MTSNVSDQARRDVDSAEQSVDDLMRNDLPRESDHSQRLSKRRRSESGRGLLAALGAAVTVLVIGAIVIVTSGDRPTATTSPQPVAGEVTAVNDQVRPVDHPFDILSLTWTRLPLEDSESTPQAVVEFDGRLVVVGDGMAWSSDDGETWIEASVPGTEPSPSFPGLDVGIRDVVEGGPGLVAVGSSPQDGLPNGAAVWTSPDGSSWSKAPGQPNETGGGTLNAVIEAGPGLVAVGAEQVFTSEDGLTWTAASQNLPTEPPFFGWLTDVTSGGPGLVAVGSQGNAAVWTSPDGLTWSRVVDDEDVFGWEWVEIRAVAAGADGLVAVGHGPLDPIDRTSDDSVQTGMGWVWTSPDGLDWTPVAHDQTVFGNAQLNDVIAVGDTLIAVGGVGINTAGGEVAAVWTSSDGLTWERLPHEAVFSGPAMTGVIRYRDGLVAVGDGAVWKATAGGVGQSAPDSSERPGAAEELRLTVLDWTISPDPPLHWSVHVVAEVGPLPPEWVSVLPDGLRVSGNLIWDEAQIELCNLYVRDTRYEILESGLGSTYVQVGDIFSRSDGTELCHRASLESAWSEYGPPEEACIMVSATGVPEPISYCAPFPTGP